MEKSELPKGWEETSLRNLIKSNVTYGILKNGEYDPSGIFMLRVMDISENGTLNDTKIFKVNKNIEKNMKIDNRKLNGNCKCEQKKIKLDRIEIGLKVVEQIVRIGSALSGLLPSIRTVFVKRIAIMI